MGTRRDYELKAFLDDAQILVALKRIHDNVERIANQGDDAFNRMGQSAQQSGIQIGAVAGIVTTLTNKLFEAAEAAIRFGKDVAVASFEAAKGLETTEASLIGVFEGNEAAALGSLDRIRRASLKLGIDLTELAPAFLPKLESLEQFERVGQLAAGLARIDPAQGAAGARIALQEALSGELLTLRRRFEIDIRPIEEAQKQFGELEGLLIGLEQVLKARGQDFESLADTAAARLGQAQEIFHQLQQTLGEPILEQVKEELEGFIDLVTEELPDGTRKVKDEFVVLAGAIGDLAADIIGLFSGFLQDFDPDTFTDLVITLNDTVDAAKLFVDTLGGFSFQDLINGAQSLLETLRNAAITAAQISTLVQAEIAQEQARDAAIQAINQERGGLRAMPGSRAGTLGFTAEEQARVDTAAQEAYNQTIRDALPAFEEYNEAVEDNRQRTDDRRESLKEDTGAQEDNADAILANKQAQAAAAAEAEEAAAAQEKLNKAFAEFDTDKARAEADLFLKQQRDLLDFEIKASQEREKIARKNLQDIAKVHRKHGDDIAKAAVDLSRDEEDIARKGARQQVELEQEIARERIRAEEDFQREIQRIKARFEFDAQEAIRANDAIAFLAAQRRRDFEIEQAREGKDEQINEAEQTAIERREALQSQLQQEIEDAEIANKRKLEDLRTSLAISLREQQIKYQQEVQEQAIAEQQKREALRKTQQEQIQDFNTGWQRRLEDLNRNYQKEIEITRRYEAQLAAIRAASARSLYRGRFAQTAALGGDVTEARGARPGASGLVEVTVPRQAISTKEFDDPNFDSAGSFGETVRRHGGGRVEAGRDYLIGRYGAEERFKPDVSGTVSPMPNAVMFNPITAGQAGNTVNNINRTTNLNIEAMLNSLSPQQLAVVTQLVHQLNMSYIG